MANEVVVAGKREGVSVVSANRNRSAGSFSLLRCGRGRTDCGLQMARGCEHLGAIPWHPGLCFLDCGGVAVVSSFELMPLVDI